jgi:hypothetical protein
MDLSVIDLRRFAIDRRVEIKVTDSKSQRVVLINTRGQIKIPDEDREFRIEEVFESADSFAIAGDAKPQSFNRAQMATAVQEHLMSRGFAAVSKDEED